MKADILLPWLFFKPANKKVAAFTEGFVIPEKISIFHS